MDDHNIQITEREFKDQASQLMLLMEYQEKFYENFLKIKLGFLAFVSVLFSVILSRTKDFSYGFLFWFLAIVFVIFLLFIWDLWSKLQDINRATKGQYRRTALAKMRDIATKDNLRQYGVDAEKLLRGEDKISQAIKERKPTEEMIKYEENIWWEVEFIAWSFLFLSIPILFLLELTGFLSKCYVD